MNIADFWFLLPLAFMSAASFGIWQRSTAAFGFVFGLLCFLIFLFGAELVEDDSGGAP